MKFFFSHKVNKIKFKRILKIFLSFFVCFLSSTFIFVSGSFFSNSKIEYDAEKISEIVNSNASSNGYISAQIYYRDQYTASKKMPNTYNEYFYWKYIFRDSDFSFLSTLNGGKIYDCYYKDLNCENITFLCVGNNSNPSKDDHFKQEVYDIDLMFKGKNQIIGDAINFVSIPLSKAKEILKNLGEISSDGEYSKSQYEKLLGINIPITMNESSHLFSIANIYFEEGNFYENVKNTFGEFVLSYIYFPEGFSLESSYIFNNYSYQNYHKIKRIKALFDEEDFSVSLSNYKTDSSSKNLFPSLLNDKSESDALSISLFVISMVLEFLFLFSFYINKSMHNLRSILVSIIVFVSPYFIFQLIKLVTKNSLLFSITSLHVYLIATIVLLLFDGFLSFKIWKAKNEKGYRLL